jgi:hypothetical protein
MGPPGGGGVVASICGWRPVLKAGAPASRPGDWLRRASPGWAGSGAWASSRAVELTGRQPPQGHGLVLVGRPRGWGGTGKRWCRCGQVGHGWRPRRWLEVVSGSLVEPTGRQLSQGHGLAPVVRLYGRGGQRLEAAPTWAGQRRLRQSEAASGGGGGGVENYSRQSGGRTMTVGCAGKNLGLQYEMECSLVTPGTFVG